MFETLNNFTWFEEFASLRIMNDEPAPSFFSSLLSSFRYPLQGDGPYIIIAGAVVFTVADFVSGYASFFGLFIQLGLTGYLATYAKDVVRTSAMGEDAPPKWADVSDWMDDLVSPALQFFFVILLTFGGLAFLQFKMPFHGVWQKITPMIAFGWGCLTFPIVFLVVAITDSFLSAMNPLPLIRAIGLTLPTYLLTVLFCGLMTGAGAANAHLQTLASRIPILPDLVGWVLTLFFITTLMRGIGLYYRFNHEKLGWY